MSLINDALRRTQDQTQAETPPRLADLEMRPLETGLGSAARSERPRMLIWVVVAIVVVANVALFALFKTVKSRQPVEARMAAEGRTHPAEPGVKSPPPVDPSTIVADSGAVLPPTPESGAATASVPQSAEAIEAVSGVPEAPEFRLQTIVTHPTQPSAMINNRVVFVGDRVEGYTVLAIDKDEVTLQQDAHEVVVSLP